MRVLYVGRNSAKIEKISRGGRDVEGVDPREARDLIDSGNYDFVYVQSDVKGSNDLYVRAKLNGLKSLII